MTNALDGIRVVDLSSGPAVGLATMILADFGAEVLRIESPQGNALDELASAPMWLRGKRSLRLDLTQDEGLAELHLLLAGADVLVCNWRPASLARKGLTFEALHTRHSHLIFAHVTGFGSKGPYAQYPGYEHVVAARMGRMREFAGLVDRPGPVFSALQVGVHACAQASATGIMAALFARGANGRGRLVETSLLQAMLAYDIGTMVLGQLEGDYHAVYEAMFPAETPPMPSLYYHPAQAGDGRWMQFGNLLPHMFDRFLLCTELIDVMADPDFNATQMTLPDEKHEAFRARMLKRIQARGADEWMTDIVADGGVAATVYETTQTALHNPDIVANGHVVQRQGGGVQLGPVARLAKTPGQPGQDLQPDRGWAAAWQATPKAKPTRQANGLPLAGIRVVELATIIAAPLATSFLADMGADVIKVEQIGGDPFRGFYRGAGSSRVNLGKRSISVNLKSAEGQEIVLGLIRDADVVVHNYRIGVPERLGIAYEQLNAINPKLIYVHVAGYGPEGPGALRPSTHPIPGAAMGGAMYQMGETLPGEPQDIEGLRLWTRRLMRANDVNPDPNTALVVATSVLLGLSARQRIGEGQKIVVDMFGANAYANHDDFLSYPGKPARMLPDKMGYGLAPTYRLYPCASEQWVFLALVSDRDKLRFCQTLQKARMDSSVQDKLQGSGDLTTDSLTELFSTQDADYWEDLLSESGVGCVRADAQVTSEFWRQDEQVAAMELTSAVHHPRFGTYRRHGTVVRFDGMVQGLRPEPLAGQHNQELVELAGFDAEHARQLEQAGVLFRDASD